MKVDVLFWKIPVRIFFFFFFFFLMFKKDTSRRHNRIGECQMLVINMGTEAKKKKLKHSCRRCLKRASRIFEGGSHHEKRSKKTLLLVVRYLHRVLYQVPPKFLVD